MRMTVIKASPMKTQATLQAPAVGYLTPSELRKRWKVSAMFLWRLRRDGKLKITKFGSRGVRIAMSEIERLERESAV
jgi:hypothetical protein